MRRYLALTGLLLVFGAGGCYDSSRYNESLDELWIRRQVESGQSVPEELSHRREDVSPSRERACARGSLEISGNILKVSGNIPYSEDVQKRPEASL